MIDSPPTPPNDFLYCSNSSNYLSFYMDLFQRLPSGPHRAITQSGFVELVDCMPRLVTELELAHGLDNRIAAVARTSNGHDTDPSDVAATSALIRYLYRHHHMSPFEFAEFDFLIRAPIFVKTHFFRHRTASVNEQSRRYLPTQADEDFYHPSIEHAAGIRKQAKTNRQSSVVNQDFATEYLGKICDLETKVEGVIEDAAVLNRNGVANEVVRFCLPVSTFTTFRFKIDLRNLLQLLYLRIAPDAQYETRQYANAILELVEPLFPATFKAWREFSVESVVLSSGEIEAIKTGTGLKGTEGEVREFKAKLSKLGLAST